jgi:hypothetical protein
VARIAYTFVRKFLFYIAFGILLFEPSASFGRTDKNICSILMSLSFSKAKPLLISKENFYAYLTPATGSNHGGDFLIFGTTQAGHQFFFIGDTTGHGNSVAPTADRISAAIHNSGILESNNFEEAHLVLEQLDKDLRLGPDESFVGSLLLFNPMTSKLSFANAGNPWAVLVRHNKTSQLIRASGSFLNENSGPAYSTLPHGSTGLSASPGDKVIVFSDGLAALFGNDYNVMKASLVSHFHNLNLWLTGLVSQSTREDDITFSVIDVP